MLSFLLIDNFCPNQVTTAWVPSTRRIVPEVETKIDAAWEDVLARPGVKLFDGPVCRFESWRRDGDRLHLDFSRTSYRIVAGTNFLNPQFADTFGPDVMGNSMGVSSGLLTRDGFWLMGRRNHCVAYYPGRVHPFAGSIEVRDDVDIFDNARRELREEIKVGAEAFRAMVLLGLVEDDKLRHPEAIFCCQSDRTREELIAAVDQDEHDGTWSVANTAEAVAAALPDPQLTPVARSVLLLGGRQHFGQTWFEVNAKPFVRSS